MKMPKIHIKRTDSKNHEATGQEKKNSFTTILPLQRVGQPKLGFGAGESVNASFSSQMMIFPGSWSPLNDAAICFMCLFPGERNICFLQNLKETKCLKNQRLFITAMTGEGSLWAHVGDITRLIYARGRLQIWTPPTVPFPRVREFVVCSIQSNKITMVQYHEYI